jgi:hypothetical protein
MKIVSVLVVLCPGLSVAVAWIVSVPTAPLVVAVYTHKLLSIRSLLWTIRN